jgi:2EXR family
MVLQQAKVNSSYTDNPLPPEIGEQIWLLTCPPRRLMIYRVMEFNEALIQNPPIASMYERLFFIHLVFNATIVNSNGRPEFFLEHERLRKNAIAWKAAHSDNLKPLPGPVALQVCRENRAICLSRYELAFAPASWTEHYGPGPASGPEWILTNVGKYQI